ncbi:MAG: SlyX family protein [Proteobacteria bacterium]|nr:SlyX family protein [Pseudomonadota bacterium]
MTDDRLIEVETKIAFQEDMLQELSKLVHQQQMKIDRLEEACKSLMALYSRLSEQQPSENISNEKPPHY